VTIEKAQHALRRAQFFLLGLANEFLFTGKNLVSFVVQMGCKKL
jgi:hypothetical protein